MGRNHMERRHGAYYLKVGKGKYILRYCRICGEERSFRSEKELETHIEESHPPEQFGEALESDSEEEGVTVKQELVDGTGSLTSNLLQLPRPVEASALRSGREAVQEARLTVDDPKPGPSSASHITNKDRPSDLSTAEDREIKSKNSTMEDGEIKSPSPLSPEPQKTSSKSSSKKRKKIRKVETSESESSSSSSQSSSSDDESPKSKKRKRKAKKVKMLKEKMTREEKKLEKKLGSVHAHLA